MLAGMHEAMFYRPHVILGGFQANPEVMVNSRIVTDFFEGLGAVIEPRADPNIRIFDFKEAPEPKKIRAVLLPESSATLHLLPDTDKLTLRVFSRHEFRVGDKTALRSKHLGVGRFETLLRNHSRPTPCGDTTLQRLLQGDRVYAQLQLEYPLSVAS
jgi:hypothetical protein